MAVDVSSLVRMMNYNKKEEEQQVISEGRSNNNDLITRDLLGGSSSSYSRLGSKELDLDVQVPLGWEKRLDLKSGKVYLTRCDTSPTRTSLDQDQRNQNQMVQDLNFPSKLSEESLELKLFPCSSSPSSSSTSYNNYQNQSVCTLDKVKSALERAEKESSKKKSSSFSSSSNKEEEDEEDKITSLSLDCSSMFAGGCPGCLLYVLISKSNPKCPRCGSIVPIPSGQSNNNNNWKKPRIDLNSSLM